MNHYLESNQTKSYDSHLLIVCIQRLYFVMTSSLICLNPRVISSPTTSYRSKCLKPAHLHMSPRLLQISGFHTPGMPLVVPPVCPRRLSAGTAPGSPSLTDRLGRRPLPSSDGVPTLSPSRRFAFRRYRPLGDPTLLLAVSSGAAPRSRAATS